MDIGDAKYVSLTTYRRNGEAVPVPVWIAPLGDGRIGFTTDATSGKVKRIRNNPSVTLRECSVRGVVAVGTAEVPSTAVIVADGPDHEATVAAVSSKYGLMYKVVGMGGAFKRLIGRTAEPSVAVVITVKV